MVSKIEWLAGMQGDSMWREPQEGEALQSGPGVSPGFMVTIHWEFLGDDAWEIQTRHDGFTSPQNAGLFASGWGDYAVAELRLREDGFKLILSDDREMELEAYSVSIWHRSRPETRSLRDDPFERVYMTPAEFARGRDATAGFSPIYFSVVGPDGEQIEVTVRSEEPDLVRVITTPLLPAEDS